jgi:TRAP-type mannitol/chloroaromatic compound transport system permease small subunit
LETHLRCIRIIDAITEWGGKAIAWLVIPLIGSLVYEVFARYFFHAPTVWAYDVTYMIYGTLFMLGSAYTLLKGGHIRTDILYRMFSVRWQGIVDASLYLLFYFPGILLFFLAGWEYAAQSWEMQERTAVSPWRAYIFPFKTVIPVTLFLLLLQGVSELLKSVHAAVKGEWP